MTLKTATLFEDCFRSARRRRDSGYRKKATRNVGHNVRGSNTKHVISVLHEIILTERNMIKATPDPYKGIVIKYPKCYKICNGSPEFKKIMVQALKQQVMDRTHKPKGTEAQREAT